MVKAGEVAIELRKLADALDKEPETEVLHATLDFYAWTKEDKERFLNLARLFSKPYVKEYSEDRLKIVLRSDAFTVYATVPRKLVCELVEPARPAVYRCEPLLSDEEEASLEVQP